MRKLVFILVYVLLSSAASAQRNYGEAMQKGLEAFDKGDFKRAINLFFAAEAFDPSKKDEVKKNVNEAFERIDRLKREAEEARRIAEFEKSNALSEKARAEKQALTAYANDLAYKSKIVFKDGDLNTAFRLAEFAFRYIDGSNNNVQQSLIDAFYFNDDMRNPNLEKLKANLNGHRREIISLAISSDGKKIASYSNEDEIKIWNNDQGEILSKIPLRNNMDIDGLSFSHDGNKLAFATRNTARHWTRNTARIWGINKEELFADWEAHANTINRLSFSPSGKFFATGSQDKTTKIWKLKQGTFQDVYIGEIVFDFKDTSPVHSVAFSPNEKFIAIGTDSIGLAAKIFRLSDGKLVKTIYDSINNLGENYNLLFSPNWDRFTTIDGSMAKIWDSKTGRLIKMIENPLNRNFKYNFQQYSYSPDGKNIIFISSDKSLRIYDLDTFSLTRTLQGHSEMIKEVFEHPPKVRTDFI